MAILSYIVDKEFEGERLDSFLRKKGGISGSVIKKAKNTPQGLTSNGQHIRTIDRVSAGAVIVVNTGEEERSYHKSDVEVEAVYEDENLVVFDKPSGMPSHPSKGHPFDTLGNVFAARKSTEGLTYRPINRLDKDTTGLVFVAKNQHSAWYFSKRIEKTYLALVEGSLACDSGRIDAAIERESADSIRRVVRQDGQHAVTNYRTVLRAEGFTMVELSLETGRTHQIRVHMSYIGHPLLGDTLYGGDTNLISRQALHCCKGRILLESGKAIEVSAPLPRDFESIIS